MARRNDSLLNAVAALPWWIGVLLAVLVFFSLRFILPVVPITHVLFKGVVQGLQTMAPLLALFILMASAVSALNTRRKRNLLEGQEDMGTIRSVSWREFEELVGEAYRRKGYRVAETGGGGADGGVDLVLRKDGEMLLVQCKNWKTYKVGVKALRELYGVMAGRGATGGIIVSSGRFTQQAMDFARGKTLELIDGDRLAKMIEGVRNTPPLLTASEPKEDNLCPRCGSRMVLRVARKGPYEGRKFWGCSGFPKCRGIRFLE